MNNRFFIIAGVSGAIAVALGAMGAHALKPLLSPEMLQAYEKAAQYQMYHTIALLGVAILYQTHPHVCLKWAGRLFIIGIILFSGSLYLLATRSLIGLENMHWIGIITPFGGASFIAGWLSLTFSFVNKKI